ncbi:MAG: SusC/RagA family TonB-linked outer membrane protein [Chitinophagales bacterium]|nr:SusC/RagA family TonB-linked outer membrane protein [Chitinophagales bacterium]
MKRILTFVFLLSILSVQVLNAQDRTVTGTVVDEINEPLPGVTVIVKGSTIGVSTDLDGKYSVVVPEGSNALVYSFIGMKTTEVALGASNVVNVNMEPDYVQVDKVVVTALGISKAERALGYSTQDVSGERINSSGEVNVVQALSSKVAGVEVTSSSGTPGASSKILLRGASHFNGDNQPLIIIDGIPASNATTNTIGNDYPFNERLAGVNNSNRGLDINPDDVESITVLKGPSAAALYGSRAGNGAIIITTKRGQGTSGSGIKATYSYNIDIAEVNKLPEFQSTYAQGDGGGSIDSLGNPVSEGSYSVADPGPDGLYLTGDDLSFGTSASWGPRISSLPESLGIVAKDNVDEFYETAISHKHHIELIGGTQDASFRLALTRNDQSGIVPNTNYERNSVRLTADANLSEKIRIGGTVNYINSSGTKAQNGSNLSGVSLSLFRTPASFDLLGGGGTEGYLRPGGEPHQYFVVYDNPYWSAYENPFTDQVNRILGSFNVNYAATDWLDVGMIVGTDVFTDQRKQIFAFGAWDPPNGPGGQIEENTITSRTTYADFFVVGRHEFSDKIKGSLRIGQNIWQDYSKSAFMRGRDFNIPSGFNNLSNTTNLYADESQGLVRKAAIFADLNLEYDGYLYLNLTGRNDWASTYGSSQSSYFFPAANIGFAFSELLPSNNILSFGKFRYGFAQTGLDPSLVSTYATSTTYTQPFFTDGFTDGLSFPYLGVNGFGNSSTNVLGNDNIRPEIVNAQEVGLDLRFWTGRVTLDYTYYYQKSTDLLIARPLARSSGYGGIIENVGVMVNKGHEIVLGIDVIRNDNLTWNVFANFSKNENEVKELVEGIDEINVEVAFSSIGAFAIVGNPYGAFFGPDFYRDDNGNLIIDQTTGLPTQNPESVNIGNPYPKFTMGLGTGLNYKDFRLNVLFDIRGEVDGWCGTCARLNRLGRTAESEDRDRTYVVEGVAQTGLDPDGVPITDGSANTVNTSAFNYYTVVVGDAGATSNAIYDASWFRLREVSAGYRLDLSKTIKKVLHAIDFNFTARNLFLVTDYPGVDPETSLTGAGSNINGFDYFNMPGSRSYNFGVKFFLK